MNKSIKFAAACAAVVCAFGAVGATVSLENGGDLTAAVKADTLKEQAFLKGDNLIR